MHPHPATGQARQQGFTLVELLVVFAIASLMIALVPAAFDRMRDGAAYRDTVRSMMTQMRDARARALTQRAEVRFVVDLGQRHFGVDGTTPTPLPAASPSALTTIGAPSPATYARAASGSVNVWLAAVGAPQAAQTSLVKALDASSRAAARPGPKVGTPPARNTSATPSTSGASGPTITNPMSFSRQNPSTFSPSRMSSATQVASSAMPAFPGAHHSRSHLGFCAKAQASACSRPPPPRIRMFMPPLPSFRRQRISRGDRPVQRRTARLSDDCPA